MNQTGRNTITSNYSDQWESVSGSTAPIPFELRRDGAAFDLTGATITITIINANEWIGRDFDPVDGPGWTSPANSPLVQEIESDACVAASATNGTLTWTPEADELETPGVYFAQVKVVKASVPYHFPARPSEFRGAVHRSLED